MRQSRIGIYGKCGWRYGVDKDTVTVYRSRLRYAWRCFAVRLASLAQDDTEGEEAPYGFDSALRATLRMTHRNGDMGWIKIPVPIIDPASSLGAASQFDSLRSLRMTHRGGDMG